MLKMHARVSLLSSPALTSFAAAGMKVKGLLQMSH